jgi:hypothetical protein
VAFSGFADFNPSFSTPLQRFLAANPGITVGSGYRDIKRQTQLWNAALQKYGSPEKARHWVAPPGKSRHNMGMAADLQFRNDAARQWAHDNAAKYGLTFRMGHEPWHIELAGAGGGDAGAGAGLDIDATNSNAMLGDTLAGAVGLQSASPLREELPTLISQASKKLSGGDTGGQPQITETRGDMVSPPQFEMASLPLEAGATTRKSPVVSPLADLFNVKTIGSAGAASTLPTRRF